MRKAIPLTLLLFLFITNLNAQKTCEDDSETYILDLNTINKCHNKDDNDAKQSNSLRNSRKVSNNSKINNRFLTIRKKKVASQLFKNINSKGVVNTKPNSSAIELVSLIALEKNYTHKIYDFISVDRIPAFNQCRYAKSDQERAVCFNKNMMTFINENINLSDDILDESIAGEVSVQFVIDTNGDTYNIQVSGPKKAKALKETIIDMVSRLPKFKPAKKGEIEVPVSYEFSLNFSI